VKIIKYKGQNMKNCRGNCESRLTYGNQTGLLYGEYQVDPTDLQKYHLGIP